jgi:DNA invertase Pin-like site-specific DNA recombinase
MPNRVKLAEALNYVRTGGTLVITKLDRLARSVAHLLEVLNRLNARGASLRILNMGIDTATPTGKLMLTVLGAVGAFEREIMLERQREGIAKAKAEGRYKGRVPTAMKLGDQIRALAAEGMTRKAIAEKLNVSERSVYRALADEEEAIA